MRCKNMIKRVLSLALAIAMLLSYIPAMDWAVEAQASETTEVVETESSRPTKYFSTSGDADNNGDNNSPERPGLLSSVKDIATWLANGYNVKLKRGDTWYLPLGRINLNGFAGTEDSPAVLGSYGDPEDPLPVIAFMLKIENNAWEVADASKNIYKADVSALGYRTAYDTKINVHRCFSDGNAYLPRTGDDYICVDYNELDVGEFCSYEGTLYIRTTGSAPTNVEATPVGGSSGSGSRRFDIENVQYLTIENIHIKGGSAAHHLIRMNAPTAHVKFQYCNITHCNYYILTMESADENIHDKPEISHCYIDSCISEAEGK